MELWVEKKTTKLKYLEPYLFVDCGIEKVRSVSFLGRGCLKVTERRGQRSVRANSFRRSIQHFSETTLGCQKSRAGDDLLMFF
jgi:hypothetical protein